jgi:type 1 glutamine amidotransferase
MPTMRLFPALLLICGALCVASNDALGDEPEKPVQVLLLSGRNNHNWQQTTPKLKSLLESSGRFKVHVEERPDQLTAEKLKPYDVIVSNWNSFSKSKKSKQWPEATKKAYLDFVRAGGGHVVVHAGSSSFPDWKEYHELTIAAWKLGQTEHGPRHDFSVRIADAEHPITKGVADFTIHDELWLRPGLQDGVTVLASVFSPKGQRGGGQNVPTAIVKQFGEGRSFTLLLGHGADQMKNPGFATLFVRGTQWAATGCVTDSASDKE